MYERRWMEFKNNTLLMEWILMERSNREDSKSERGIRNWRRNKKQWRDKKNKVADGIVKMWAKL